MKLKLKDNIEVILPPFSTVAERINLVNEIISKYLDSFTLNGFEINDKNVMIRTDIVGTYILQADKEKGNSIMTRYKEKRRPYQEWSISNLYENNQLDIENTFGIK